MELPVHKLLFHGGVWLLIALAAGTGYAQNRVLQLDGDGDYVQLPRTAFDDLDESTVESWIKWEEFGYFSQPWGFGSGQTWNVMCLTNQHYSNSLQFFIYEKEKLHRILVPNVLRQNQWCHISAVSGPAGMHLYLNGILIGQNEYQGSFSTILPGDGNYIGESHWPSNKDFHGQLDEIRLWDVARTAEEINASMSRRLTGEEDHLVALWTFDSNDASDATGHGYDGVFMGDAQCVEADLPLASELARPSQLSGKITDETGSPLPGANVILEQDARVVATTRTDETGRYQIMFYPQPGLYDLTATWDTKAEWQQGLEAAQGRRYEVNLALHTAVSLTGALKAYDSSPQPAVIVQAVPVTETGTPMKPTTVQGDENGHFRFINLRPGPYRVRAYAGDRYVYYSDVSNAPSATEPGTILHVGHGRLLQDIDMRFAPFKKGLWRTYTYLDGLANNYVNAIENDVSGRIWFGTETGLSLFDGRAFTTFTKEDGLISNWVYVIYLDSEGMLWIGTQSGLSRYDGRVFTNFTMREGLAGMRVLALYQDSKGRMWAGTDGGLSQYDGSKFVICTRPSKLPTTDINAITEDNEGNLWIGTGAGLVRYDGHQFQTFTKNEGLVDDRILALHRDNQGVLWIGTYQGLSRYTGRAFVNFTVADGLVHDTINSITEDKDGRLWFGTMHGVSLYDGQGFVAFTPSDGLAYWPVAAIHQDINGKLWFGTLRGGASCYDDHTIVNFNIQDGLADNTVRAITEEQNGTLWLGTNGGPTCYKEGTFTAHAGQNGLPNDWVTDIYRTSDGILWFGTKSSGLCRYDGKSVKIIDSRNGLVSNWVSAICRGHDGRLWIGRSGGGIACVDTDTLTVKSLDLPENLQSIHPRSIYPDDDGIVWIGTNARGLLRYDKGKFVNLTPEDGLLDIHVEAICRGLDGMLWLATNEGLSRYNGERFYDLTTANGLADRQILDIFEDRKGKFWLGTQSAGVMLYDGTNFSTLDTRDGLASNTVYAIYEDSAGAMWFGTEEGLSCYRPRTATPGIQIVSLQAKHKYENMTDIPPLTSGRRLSFAYSALDLSTLPEKHQYRVKIRRATKSQIHMNETTDPAGESLVSVLTRATTFDWTPDKWGTYVFEVQVVDRNLNYSKPAKVTLRVVPPLYLNARIVVPSAAGLIIVLGVLTFLSVRLLSQRRKAQQLQVQLLENERQKNVLLEEARDAAETANKAKSIFLANMSHDIRTPLNAILGYAQVLLRKQDLTKEIHRAISTIAESGNHLLSLINDILDISRIEAGRPELTLTDFDMIHFIEGLSSELRLRCDQKGLTWRVEWDDSPKEPRIDKSISHPVRWIVHADEGKLRQILMNLLFNAVKFTDSGYIVLRIGELDQNSPQVCRGDVASLPEGESQFSHLMFEVLDSGIGIPLADQENIFEAFTQSKDGRAKGGTGLGLAIAKKSVELMGGSIGVESVPEKGSRFFFTVPIKTIPETKVSHSLDSQFGGSPRILRLAEGQQVHALVVDDIQENRDVLAQLLKNVGATVETADGGRQAIKTIQESPFDIVFMDIRMPDIDGLMAAQEILHISTVEHPKLVAVSASALPEQRQEYLKAGFEEFLAKPIDAENIYSILAQLLQVNFQYSPSKKDMAGFEKVSLPEELLNRLRAAAEVYKTTELKRYLEEVEQLGEEGRELAEQLRNWTERSELDKVMRILTQIEVR